jgi:hypothetical protein
MTALEEIVHGARRPRFEQLQYSPRVVAHELRREARPFEEHVVAHHHAAGTTEVKPVAEVPGDIREQMAAIDPDQIEQSMHVIQEEEGIGLDELDIALIEVVPPVLQELFAKRTIVPIVGPPEHGIVVR